jgi:hypothetical protein
MAALNDRDCSTTRRASPQAKEKKTMRKRMIIIITALMFLGGIEFAPSAHAAGQCGLQTVGGSYGTLISGSLLGLPLGGASVGVVNFNGAGSVTGSDVGSLNGAVFPANFTGSYTVDADCTGTMTVIFDNGFTGTHRILIVDNGREIRSLVTLPGAAITGIFKRITGQCNPQTIRGGYGGIVTGQVPGLPLTAVAGSPALTFDGAGAFTGRDVGSFGGMIGTSAISGTYTLGSDCTGTLNNVFENGFTIPSRIVAVDGGKEIFMLITAPGQVVSGTFKRQ